MVTKKTIFNSLLVIAILFICNVQRAMELQKLKLLKKIKDTSKPNKTHLFKKHALHIKLEWYSDGSASKYGDYSLYGLGCPNITLTHKNTQESLKLPGKNYQIFASPKKDSPYILIDEKNTDTNGTKTLTLYDNKTWQPIEINGKKNKNNIGTFIPNVDKKILYKVFFGKNDEFAILVFHDEVFLYDLSKFKQVDTDLCERLKYLHNPEYIKENQEKICNISFGGLQETILILKIFLML